MNTIQGSISSNAQIAINNLTTNTMEKDTYSSMAGKRKSNLTSDDFLTRAFAILGHMAIAYLLVYLGALAIFGLILGIGVLFE